MTAMQFKTFIWPHNPKIFQARLERRVAALKHPGGGYTLQDLGVERRVFEGEGEFFGENAYEQFQALANVFCDSGAGTLYHPAWGGSSAYFTQLELLEEPRENYVAYQFTFVAEPPEAAVQSAAEKTVQSAPLKQVTLRPGQTLEAVCSAYGLRMEELLRKNPQIANPAMVPAGTKVAL